MFTLEVIRASRIKTCLEVILFQIDTRDGSLQGEIYVLLLFFQLAEQLYLTMSKRFSQSKKVWVGFGAFYMKQGKLDLGRKLLQRSLKSLPKRKRK